MYHHYLLKDIGQSKKKKKKKKMNKVNSQLYTFCNMEPETFEYVLFNSFHVKNIWLYIFSKWQNLTGNHYVPTLRSCVLDAHSETIIQLYCYYKCI